MAQIAYARHPYITEYSLAATRGRYQLPPLNWVVNGRSEALRSVHYHFFGGLQEEQPGIQRLRNLAIPPAITEDALAKAKALGVRKLFRLKLALQENGLGHVIFGSKPIHMMEPVYEEYETIKELHEKEGFNNNYRLITSPDEENYAGRTFLVNLPNLDEHLCRYREILISLGFLTNTDTLEQARNRALEQLPNIFSAQAHSDPRCRILQSLLLGYGKEAGVYWSGRYQTADAYPDAGNYREDLYKEMDNEIHLHNGQRKLPVHLPQIPQPTIPAALEPKQLIDNWLIESSLLITRWQGLGCATGKGGKQEAEDLLGKIGPDYLKKLLRHSLNRKISPANFAAYDFTERSLEMSGADVIQRLTSR